jgi:hypothetical protein
MGNEVCIHCGVPLDYYSSLHHAGRQSCHSTEKNIKRKGYHYFVTSAEYKLHRIKNALLQCCRE